MRAHVALALLGGCVFSVPRGHTGTSLTLTNGTHHPICHVWQKTISAQTGNWELVQVFGARSVDDCLAPGKSTTFSVRSDAQGGGGYVVAENVAATAHADDPTTPLGNNNYDDTATLEDTWHGTPTTIEGYERQNADHARAAAAATAKAEHEKAAETAKAEHEKAEHAAELDRNRTVQLVDHTRAPICHLWQSVQDVWKPVLDAKSAAQCVKPGGRVTVRFDATEDSHAFAMLQARSTLVTTGADAHAYEFDVPYGKPLVFELPSKIRDEDVVARSGAPMTIEATTARCRRASASGIRRRARRRCSSSSRTAFRPARPETAGRGTNWTRC